MTSQEKDKPTINLEGASIGQAQFGNHNRMDHFENNPDNKRSAKHSTVNKTIAISLFVLGVGITFTLNVATSILPKSLDPYLWLSWPLLVVFSIVSVIFLIKQ